MICLSRLLFALLTPILSALIATLPSLAQTPKPISEAQIKAAGGRQQLGAEIKQSMTGNTVYVLFLSSLDTIKAGTVVRIYHRDDRHRAIRLGNGQKLESNWWIDGNAYCAEQRIVNVGHACYTSWELSGIVYSCLQPGGDCLATNRIMQGNPENL